MNKEETVSGKNRGMLVPEGCKKLKIETLRYEQIVARVADTLVAAGSTFRNDKKEAYRRAIKEETNPKAKWVLETILENAEAAEKNHSPLCDDTGIPHVVLEAGPDTAVTGRMLDAIKEGIAQGLIIVDILPVQVKHQHRIPAKGVNAEECVGYIHSHHRHKEHRDIYPLAAPFEDRFSYSFYKAVAAVIALCLFWLWQNCFFLYNCRLLPGSLCFFIAHVSSFSPLLLRPLRITLFIIKRGLLFISSYILAR